MMLTMGLYPLPKFIRRLAAAVACVLALPVAAHATLVPPFFINSVVALGAMQPVLQAGGPPHFEWRTAGTGFFYAYLGVGWIFMDMTISRELSAFGESLKERWLPGKRDPIFGIHSRYIEAQGNLAEMTKVDWNEVLERWNMRFWWALAFPIAAIWASFYWHYTTLGLWLAGIYAIVVIAYVGIKFSRLVGLYVGSPEKLIPVHAYLAYGT